MAGGSIGIGGRNEGTGPTTIKVGGDVSGPGLFGIAAENVTTTPTLLTIETAARASVTGRFGIVSRSPGGSEIIVRGDVTGTTADGIAFLENGPATIQNLGTITSNSTSANNFAINFVFFDSCSFASGPGNVINAGTIRGGLGGGAIRFSHCGAGYADRLELQPGSSITGLVLAGPNSDTFVLGGSGSQSFEVSLLDADDTPEPGEQFLSFEVFEKEGSSTWTLTGNNDEINPFFGERRRAAGEWRVA